MGNDVQYLQTIDNRVGRRNGIAKCGHRIRFEVDVDNYSIGALIFSTEQKSVLPSLSTAEILSTISKSWAKVKIV